MPIESVHYTIGDPIKFERYHEKTKHYVISDLIDGTEKVANFAIAKIKDLFAYINEYLVKKGLVSADKSLYHRNLTKCSKEEKKIINKTNKISETTLAFEEATDTDESGEATDTDKDDLLEFKDAAPEKVENEKHTGFLTKTILYEGQQLGPTEVEAFSSIVNDQYTDSITILDGCPKKNEYDIKYSIDSIKPSNVIKQDKLKEITQNLIFYPFVYSSNSKIGIDHIVLITIDRKNKTIYYYDSQGLSSDDQHRIGNFPDNPKFNMREDLKSLGKELFDGDFTIIENHTKNQTDPHNCGVYVLNMMEQQAIVNEINKDLKIDTNVIMADSFKDTCEKFSNVYGTSLRKHLGTTYASYHYKKNKSQNKSQNIF